MNPATTFVIASKDAQVLVCPLDTFSYGPEETTGQLAEKLTAELEAKGYECKVGTIVSQEEVEAL